jgi:Secretion system C-terminal sorting domain
VGTAAPAASLPAGWVHTGETRNGIIDNGTQGVIESRQYGYTNTVNFDFGIEQLPSSNPFYVHIRTPTVGQLLTLNGGTNPPVFSGKDAEDCTSGCTMDGRTIVIDSLPSNSNLYYNGVLVTAGQLITNFDPNLFQVEFTAVTVGSSSRMTEFYYSFVDAAGMKDPVSAIYSINWLMILPTTGMQLTATRTGNDILLNWKTLTEIQSDYFEIERSTDGRNFTKVGTTVKAAGNSDAVKLYSITDDARNINVPMVYYRISLAGMNGKKAYSNVATVKLPENGAVIRAVPNPFISQIMVSASVEGNSSFSVRIMDISGRAISNEVLKITKDIPTVTIKNLHGLMRGIYLVEVTDLLTGKKQVFKMEKVNQ